MKCSEDVVKHVVNDKPIGPVRANYSENSSVNFLKIPLNNSLVFSLNFNVDTVILSSVVAQ